MKTQGLRAGYWDRLPEPALLNVHQYLSDKTVLALSSVSRAFCAGAPSVIGIHFLRSFPWSRNHGPSGLETRKGRRAARTHFEDSGGVLLRLRDVNSAAVRETDGARDGGGTNLNSGMASLVRSIPCAAAPRIRFLSMPVTCFSRHDVLPTLHMFAFGRNLTNLVTLHLSTHDLCTLPDDPRGLSKPILSLVRNTKKTLRELDIDAGTSFEFSDCMTVIQSLGAALVKLRLNHHPWRSGGIMLDRSSTLRAEIDRIRPGVVHEISSVVLCHTTTLFHGLPPIIASPYQYMEDNPDFFEI